MDGDNSLGVRKLTDERQLERITDWMHAWWGEREGYSREAVRCQMAHGLQATRLPQTYGLFLGDALIGMYQFTLEDLFSRPDLYPWLANVYVDEPYRHGGYGRFLLSSVKEIAEQNLAFNELFLFTEHIGLYEKFGWEFVETIDTFWEPRFQRLYRMPLK